MLDDVRRNGGNDEPAGPGATSAPPPHDHEVQFYESEGFLRAAVVDFLAEGLAAGQPLVVIARPRRREAFEEGLKARGLDVGRARRTGALVLLDARETLAGFMDEGVPDEQRFRMVVGAVIERSIEGREGSGARAYGEMVDVLWRAGNRRAALRVEELWNELARVHSFSLLCAYAMGHFYREGDARHFRDVCARHGTVRAVEGYDPRADEATRVRQVGVLQQRARALTHEVEERRRLELALRDALESRKRVEGALREAKAEAEEASRAKSEFLAVMSHELRTPLNAIIGYQDLLAHGVGGAVRPEQAGFLSRIRFAADELLGLIEQILSFSRIEAGKEEVRVERLDLSAVAADAVAMLRPAASERGLSLCLRTPGGPVPCETDPWKLRQILLNLLSNGVKFTERGKVQVRVGAEGDAVWVRVRDTGAGIHPGDLGRIFEPFVQADVSTTRGHGGPGLGLPVSRQLARLLGGDVSVASTPGKGSTFTLSLPAAQPAPAGG